MIVFVTHSDASDHVGASIFAKLNKIVNALFFRCKMLSVLCHCESCFCNFFNCVCYGHDMFSVRIMRVTVAPLFLIKCEQWQLEDYKLLEIRFLTVA